MNKFSICQTTIKDDSKSGDVLGSRETASLQESHNDKNGASRSSDRSQSKLLVNRAPSLQVY